MTTLAPWTVAQRDTLFQIASFVILLSALAVIVGAAYGVVMFFIKGAFDDVDDDDPPAPPDDVVSREARARLDALRQPPSADVPAVRVVSYRDDGLGFIGPHPPYGRRKGDWTGPTH